MPLFETKINLHLAKEGKTYLAGEVLDIDQARAKEICDKLDPAFPKQAPVLTAVGEEVAEDDPNTLEALLDVDTDGNGKLTKAELHAALDAKGIKYKASATNAELEELLKG